MSNPRPLPALEYLKSILSYDPDTGIFTWLRKLPKARIQIGQTAGCNDKGYICIKIDGTKYRAHRLAYYIGTETTPVNDIDHINGNKLDNRLNNLRQATASENQHNKRKCRTNTTGYKGVSFHQNKYQASIGYKGKLRFLGMYDTPEQAAEAYRKAALNLHGAFARFD